MGKWWAPHFAFKQAGGPIRPTEDPYASDKAAAQATIDFQASAYRRRLDTQLDVLLSLAFEKRELEKAAGIQAVRDFLRRDFEDAQRVFDE